MVNVKKNRKFFVFAGVIFIVCIIFICNIYSNKISKNHFKKDNSVSIFEYEDIIELYVCRRESAKEDEILEETLPDDIQDNGKDYVNYWIQAQKGISLTLLYKSDRQNAEYFDRAKAILDSLKETFYTYNKFPRPQYKDLKYGWVSSMDAPSIMLLSQMVYELTGQEQYREFVNDLKKYIVKDISEGGFNATVSGTKWWGKEAVWPLEYASVDLDSSEYMYVNNGSITGFLGCKIIALIDQDKEFEKFCDSVERAYELKESEFIYPRYTWTFYMLNNLTVIPPHYMIFEEQLYDAARKICKSEFWENGFKFRRDALKSVLKMEFVSTDNGILGIMRRACAPHPYLLDIYCTRIEFVDENGDVVDIWEKNISGSLSDNINEFQEGEFLNGIVSEKATNYNVYVSSRYKNNEIKKYLIFNDKIEGGGISEMLSDDIVLQNNVSCSENMVQDNIEKMKFYLEQNGSETTTGRIEYKLKEHQRLNIQNYYGIEIDNIDSSDCIVRIVLQDSDGNSCERYMPKLISGKNLILISEIGFPDINNLKDIDSITVRLSVNGQDGEKDEFVCGNLLQFKNLYTLYSYRNTSKYKISPE